MADTKTHVLEDDHILFHLHQLVATFKEFNCLITCHMNDFITSDTLENTKDERLTLEESLKNKTHMLSFSHFNNVDGGGCFLLHQDNNDDNSCCKCFSYQTNNSCCYCSYLKTERREEKKKINSFLSPKKEHEILHLSDFLKGFSQDLEISKVRLFLSIVIYPRFEPPILV